VHMFLLQRPGAQDRDNTLSYARYKFGWEKQCALLALHRFSFCMTQAHLGCVYRFPFSCIGAFSAFRKIHRRVVAESGNRATLKGFALGGPLPGT